ELAALAGEVQVLRPFRLVALCQGRGDEPARHHCRVGDAAADRGAHGGKARTPQEAAPVNAGPAPEHTRVGALRVVAIELLKRTFAPVGHGSSSLVNSSFSQRFS